MYVLNFDISKWNRYPSKLLGNDSTLCRPSQTVFNAEDAAFEKRLIPTQVAVFPETSQARPEPGRCNASPHVSEFVIARIGTLGVISNPPLCDYAELFLRDWTGCTPKVALRQPAGRR